MRTSIVALMIVASGLLASCGKKTADSPVETTMEMEDVQETTEIENVELLEAEDSVEVVEEIVNTPQ